MKPGAPLPWKQWPGADHPNAPILIGQPGQHVCAISGAARAQPGAEQNAAYIAHAANLYPELVEALEDLANIARAINAEQHAGLKIDGERWSDMYDTEAHARAVLAKAKGER